MKSFRKQEYAISKINQKVTWVKSGLIERELNLILATRETRALATKAHIKDKLNEV